MKKTGVAITENRICPAMFKLFIFGEETHLSLTVLGNVSIANSSIPVLCRERWSSDNSGKFDDALHRFVR